MCQRTRRLFPIYAVTKGGSCRFLIGVACMHEDSKGFDLHLQTMPLMAAQLIAREEGAEWLPES